MINRGKFKLNQNGSWSVVFEEFRSVENGPVSPYHQVVALHPDDVSYAVDGTYTDFQKTFINKKQYWRVIN